MKTKAVSIRVSTVGGKAVVQEFEQIGNVGSRSLRQIEKDSRRSGMAMQNASYQVQDFFVQIAGGTDPMRALSQQLPQLLGGMGLIGGLAGTAVAGLSVLWTVMGDGDESAGNLTESIDELSAAADNYLSSVRAANAGTDELTEKYGRASEMAREFLGVQRDIDAVKAQDAINATISNAVSEVTRRGFQKYDDNIYARIDDLENASYDLQETFGLTEERANELARALETLSLADGPRDQADAAKEVMAALEGSLGFYSQMDEEARVLFGTMLEIAREADNVALTNELAAGSMALFENAAANAISWVSQLTGETDGLAGAAERAAQNMWDFLGAQGAAAREYSESVGSGRGLGPGGPELDPYGFRNQLERDGRRRPPRATGGGRRSGGGGGGNSAQNAELRAAEQLFASTRTAAEKYAAEVEKIDGLLGKGLITQDTYNRALEQAGEKYLELEDSAKFFEDINVSLKDSIIDLGVDGVASIDGITDALKRAAWQSALFGEGPLANLLDGGRGLLGGFFGAGGFLGDLLSFEGGGDTGTGSRSGGLDGRGGFLAMLHPDETVIDRRAGGAGSGGVRVEVKAVPTPYFDLRVTQVASAQDQRAAALQRRAMPKVLRDSQARGL